MLGVSLNYSGESSASANDKISAKGFKLFFIIQLSDINKIEQAPSLILLAFAPVIVPSFPGVLKTGFNLNIFFLLNFCGSSSIVINPFLVGTPTISQSNIFSY